MQIDRPLKLTPQTLFYGLSILLLASIFTAIATDFIYVVVVPLVTIGVLMASVNYRILYYILIAGIPLSYHLELSNSLTTDIPGEPLMMLFLGIAFVEICFHWQKHNKLIQHPLFLILLLGVIWACLTCIYSVNLLVSVKYLIAKLWYIAAFVIITAIIIKNIKDWKIVFWFFFLALLFSILVVLIQYSAKGFSFAYANKVLSPFYPNHVIYSTTIALFLPYIWYARLWYPKGSIKRRFLNISLLIFLFAIITSYTRATWLSIPAILAYTVIVQKKYFNYFIIGSVLSIAVGTSYLLIDNNYLKFAPDFEKTIFNEGNLDKHLEATYKFEDVSGMERVYRWVAAKNLIAENPFLGTGPNTFHPEYKKYTESAFVTYVSDNPEQSTTHNYFLMVFSEQGFPGFILFVLLVFFTLKLSSNLYHNLTDQDSKNLVMAATLSIVVILVHLLLNDLIETHKIGTMFYLAIALIIRVDIEIKNQNIKQDKQVISSQ